MAALYLLDICIVVPALNGQPRAPFNRLAALAPLRLYISSLMHAKLFGGAEKA